MGLNLRKTGIARAIRTGSRTLFKGVRLFHRRQAIPSSCGSTTTAFIQAVTFYARESGRDYRAQSAFSRAKREFPFRAHGAGVVTISLAYPSSPQASYRLFCPFGQKCAHSAASPLKITAASLGCNFVSAPLSCFPQRRHTSSNMIDCPPQYRMAHRYRYT